MKVRSSVFSWTAKGLMLSAIFFPSCSKKVFIPNPVDTATLGSIETIVSLDPNLQNVDNDLKSVRFIDSLGKGSYTLLAYNNNFRYPASPDTVLYHVLRGAQRLKNLPIQVNQPFQTVEGNPIYISQYLVGKDTVLAINGTPLSLAQSVATNGFVDYLNVTPFWFAARPTTDYIVSKNNYKNLKNAVGDQPNMILLSALLGRVNLDDILTGSGPYTFFAPSDRAFMDTGNHFLRIASVADVLNADTARLVRLLKEHIVRGRLFMSDFTINKPPYTLMTGKTLAGDSLRMYLGIAHPFGNMWSALALWGPGNTVDTSQDLYYDPSIQYLGPYGDSGASGNLQTGISTGNGVLFYVDHLILPK